MVVQKKFTPSVGRIVHYVRADVHKAAIITHIWADNCVNLYVLPTGIANDGYAFIATSIRFTTPENMEDYSCHWPERTE